MTKKNFFKVLVGWFLRKTLRLLPSTRFFRLKAILLRFSGVNVSSSASIVSSVTFEAGQISIGSETWVGHDVLFVGGDARISIGDNCDIAPRVVFVSGTHKIEIGQKKAAGTKYSLPIEVKDGCWICTGAVILGGSSIGSCSIVAAGAVVRGEFPARSLIGGVPAKLIRCLRPEEEPDHSMVVR